MDEEIKIEDLIREKVGEKFVLSFIGLDGNIYTYTSSDLNEIEQVYLGANIQQIAFNGSNAD